MLRLVIDPERPNPRQIQRIVDIIHDGGIVVYPTDTFYGLGCDMMQKRSVEKVYAMKGKDRKHPLSFICSDLKNISRYGVVSNVAYKLMRRIFPGPYTVILPSSREVPRIMQSKSATVGIRIPEHPVALMLAQMLDNPIVTTSVPSDEGTPFSDPERIMQRFPFLDGVIDCGIIAPQPSTILDLSSGDPRLIRQGKGSIEQIPNIVLSDE
ncbi:MAG: L-threonylcarbamoyladenylate synthase [Bradymonadia bacterium]|jgi:tRNA threonylcarbamoyl adenosine modification protein (Sua5/YciO/YrdC/YwlC family)